MRIALALAAAAAIGCGSKGTADRASKSAEAFLRAYPVFMHPRCSNCHPAGDAPLQGDDQRPHAQNVQRGPDGRGLLALKCSACHQDATLPGRHLPPGNPNWHLPPADMPMVFVNRSPRQLADQLKDRNRNGGKTILEILRHVEEDSLVRTCWAPGDGRTSPPLSHPDFARAVKEWVDGGAVSPE